jgi:hypothetical protein
MALKLDMSKAYDKVEWNFLAAIMKRMGFAEQWVGLIIACIKIVSYFVLVNDQPHGKNHFNKRQGDPISPYLFILCDEGLSSVIQKAKEKKLLSAGLSDKRGNNT